MNYKTRRQDKLLRTNKRSRLSRKIAVKINRFLLRLKVLFAISMLFALFLMIFVKPLETTAQGVTNENSTITAPDFAIENSVKVEAKQMEVNDEYYLMLFNNYPWEVCDLTFWTPKDKGYMNTPPAWFVKDIAIKEYSCNDQKWLTRLAQLESEYNPNAVNGAFKGLFQIGQDARDMCIANGRNKNDYDCALYLKDWLPIMPLMFEVHYKYPWVFSDLV